jgi:sugar lactone lactonase YvrE
MSSIRKITRARRRSVAALGAAAAAAALGLVGTAGAAAAAPAGYHMHHYGLGSLARVKDEFVSTTIDPVTGDINPYGVAIAPVTSGALVKGDVLVSDFNNFGGTSGAGTSIVEIDPKTGAVSNFANGGSIAGPDALTFNPKGFLWVGNFGAANSSGVFDGSNGNIAVLGPTGSTLATFDQTTTGHGFFAGTWGQEYGMNKAGKVSFYWPDAGENADAGTVWRLDPNPGGTPNGQPINSTYTLLAAGLGAGGTSAATAVGPQGLAYDPSNDTLYVADDATNEILAIPHASTATGPVMPKVILKGGPLDSPQGIVYDPVTGRLFTVNGAVNNDLIELTVAGHVLGVRNLAPNEPAGALFGLTFNPSGSTHHTTNLYYVNDDENSLHALSVDPTGKP